MSIDVNFIILSEAWLSETEENKQGGIRLFGGEPITFLPANTTMWDILAKAGVFSSKSEARKNWRGAVEIPKGFSEHTIGKLKHKVWILNWA